MKDVDGWDKPGHDGGNDGGQLAALQLRAACRFFAALFTAWMISG